MPSTFSLLSKQDSSIVTISKEVDSQKSYRVNSINLRRRSQSQNRQFRAKIKNIQIMSKMEPNKLFAKKRKTTGRKGECGE